MAMLSYHNNHAIKEAIVSAMIADKKAERLVQREYIAGKGKNFKGCFIGCVTRTASAEKTAQVLGENVILVRLREGIFEGLSIKDAREFAVNCLQATPVGKDMSLVPWKFLDRMLKRTFSKIDKANPVHLGCAAALNVVARKALGEVVDRYAVDAAYADADAAADAVYAAAYADADAAADAAYAAYAAAYPAANAADAVYAAANAANAANAAAYPAANAANAAADAVYAVYAAANAAANADEIKEQAKDLIELLQAA